MEGLRRRNPAVCAGLLGAVVASAPELAHGETLLPAPLDDSLVSFAIGLLLGSAITGLSAAIVLHAARSRSSYAAHQDDSLDATTHLGGGDVGSSRVAPSSSPAGHIATDYEDIAENYVRRETLSERLAARARGVKDVLTERLGGDRFEGLPIIERADGSVGDVGTGWWDARLGNSVRHVGEIESRVPSFDSLEVPEWMGEVASGRSSDISGEASRARPLRPSARSRSRAAIIARSVAEVDQGVYPAKRSAVELDHTDVWEVALAAMGEKIDQMQPAVTFSDVVGGAEGADDVEGLESPTSFIPFRTPAGHPEVVDTETYVDYLINDEFSRNGSQAARRSSRNYLHVIEGGSQAMKSTAPLRVRHRASEHEAYKPKHMAVSAIAREA